MMYGTKKLLLNLTSALINYYTYKLQWDLHNIQNLIISMFQISRKYSSIFSLELSQTEWLYETCVEDVE